MKRFKHGAMKNRVNTGTLQQFELISGFTGTFNNFIWTIVSLVELRESRRISREWGLSMRTKFYHYPIALIKIDIPSLCVSNLFHNDLSFQELLSNFSENSFSVCQHVVNGRHIRSSSNILKNVEGLLTKDDFIWWSSRTQMPWCIVRPFYLAQESNLFCLPTSLWVICGTHPQTSVTKPE